MSASRHISLLGILLLALTIVSRVSAQENAAQTEGWQGPRPAPQQCSTSPAPQQPFPSPGPQVLEIPSLPQQPPLPPPKQQAVIPPLPQPERPRPTQLLAVTVTDPQGRYVSGLQPEDFLVYEEDLPQKITYFNTGQNEPMSLGLLVDESGSMLNKIGRAQAALRLFADAIHARDEVFLEAFNQQPKMLQDFTDSPALLAQAASQLQPQGETALYDAILDGLRRVQKGRNQKKALVVLTDGLDTSSTASLPQTLDAVRRAGILVYTIGIGNPAFGLGNMARRGYPLGGGHPLGGWHRGGMGVPLGLPMGAPPGPLMGPRMGRGVSSDTVDDKTLQLLSTETGAKHFLLNTTDVVSGRAVLDGAVQTIANELRQQYSLGYTSPLKGEVYRSVRVEARRGDLTVRTRKGSE